jgi:hypothetical protein
VFGRSTAVVHGELDEQEIRIGVEGIPFQPETGQVGTRARMSGFEGRYLRIGILLLKPPGCHGSPTLGVGDAAAEVGDRYVVALV